MKYKIQDVISEDSVLLEFFDEDEYAFFKNLPKIYHLIDKECTPVYVREKFYSNDDDIYRSKNKNKNYNDNEIFFRIKHDFDFLRINKNHYIITNSKLGIIYFISFNTINILNYCLKLINNKKIKKDFIKLIELLPSEVENLTNKIREKSSEEIKKERKTNFKQYEYVTQNELQNLNFASDAYDRRYFKILLNKDINIENNIYSIYKFNNSINDFDIKLVKTIFTEIDYMYINIYKEFIKYYKKIDLAIKESDVINEEIAEKVIKYEKRMSKIIEGECLKIRKEMIENVLKKINPEKL